MTAFMHPRIQYERQMREEIKVQRVAPYRIITGEMITEMFSDINIGHSYSNTIINMPENRAMLTKWCGSDGMYMLDDGMREFFKKYGLKYKW